MNDGHVLPWWRHAVLEGGSTFNTAHVDAADFTAFLQRLLDGEREKLAARYEVAVAAQPDPRKVPGRRLQCEKAHVQRLGKLLVQVANCTWAVTATRGPSTKGKHPSKGLRKWRRSRRKAGARTSGYDYTTRKSRYVD